MEKYKQLITRARELANEEDHELLDVLWALLLYSPKTAVKPYQRQQLDEAAKFEVEIFDKDAQTTIRVKGFKWGKGSHKIMLTHGWASKAADFSEIIIALRQLPDVTIIAFDAPGNGSSEGKLSNLLLFIEALKAVIRMQGTPDTLIGHSIGAIANITAIQEMELPGCPQLISLCPLIRLKEIFIGTMDTAHASAETKKTVLKRMEAYFNMPVNGLDLDQTYRLDGQVNHWLAYDKEDVVSSYYYIHEFLEKHPSIKSQQYTKLGHAGILKDPEVITDVLKRVYSQINPQRSDVA
jgi:pimeloyl-ACP methyl ester carboxylesterase